MTKFDKARWQALTPLFEQLLDARAEERAARLAQVEAQDAALGADLACLLALHAKVETEGFLEGNALDCAGNAATLAGKTLGNYTLLHEIGAGGMGTVWLAQRSDGRFEGQVAVKLLNLGLFNRIGAARFKREGNALARLAHPNIAHLLDAGDVDGHPFLVMEYVDGAPIDAWCDARSLGVEARIRLFLQVMAAVAYAHGRLILHRDLKPSNMLVTGSGVVKLLDFGIAKLLADEASQAPRTELTELGGRALTVEYAAPEQVQGADVSTATDVYALGVLVLQLLTGAHPTSRSSMGHVERLRAIIEAEPLRASDVARDASPAVAAARSTTAPALSHALRGDLDNILAKALQKIPVERYATVEAFAADLQRVLEHQPVSVRAGSRMYSAAKFIRRNRAASAAAGALLLLLAAGIAGTTWQAIEARRERDEALWQAQMSRAQGNLVNLLWGAIGEEDRPMTQRELLAKSTQLVNRQFGSDPRVAARLLLPIAGQYFTLGDVEKDLETMQLAARFAQASGDPDLVADVACDTVNTEIRLGRVDVARTHLRTAKTALERAARRSFETVVECLRAEADVEDLAGNTRRAIEVASQALAEAERALPGSEDLYKTVLSLLSVLHLKNNDLAAGYALIKKHQQRNERLGQTDAIDYLVMRRSEAMVLMSWGEYRAARTILDALAAKLSDPPPWLGHAQGQLLLREGDLAGAQRTLARAASLSRKLGYEGHAVTMELWLTWVLAESKQFDEARRLLARLEAIAPSPAPDQPITLGIVRSTLLLAQGSVAAAEQAIQEDLKRIAAGEASDSPMLSASLLAAARMAAAGADPERALQAARAAYDVAHRVARDPEQSGDVGEALLMVARAQQRLGATTEAAAAAAQAAVCLRNGLGDSHSLTAEARQIVAKHASGK